MSRKLVIGWIVAGCLGFAWILTFRGSEAAGQRPRDEPVWEYKVTVFSYNPGERTTDEKRAAQFEKALNNHARQGWELVGTILSRDEVATIGGGVTTRGTDSFVTFRRAKK